MTTTLARHISFIQSPFLTKFIELDFNLNLIFEIKSSGQSKMLWRFAMHFNARKDLVFDCICNVKYEAFFTIARPFPDTRIFS